jgi:hypothetical protein
MIKGIVITLLMMELLSESAVESKIPAITAIPSVPHNGQGQCLTEDMKVIECITL